jgi:hypothetical protein
MALLECKIRDGLRPAEVTVELKDFSGRPQYLPIDRDFIEHEEGKPYLPVSVVHIDRDSQAVLVGLPVEADSGAHRIWVWPRQLKYLTEEMA